MFKHQLTIATRNSPLALAQTEQVKQKLTALYPELGIELLPMVTQGDKFLANPLYEIGGKALFLKELEQALLDHQADIAVHSLKDMPATLPSGLALGAVCRRDNPYDLLVLGTKYPQHQPIDLNRLPQRAVIGTSSLRRKAQLLAYRPDLIVRDIRGNVNSRLNKLNQADYDALILAAAGLVRLRIKHPYQTMLFPTNILLPAPGQGAIAIELRSGDQPIAELIKPLNDMQTFLCVSAERIIQDRLEAGCQTPLAAYAEIDEQQNMDIAALVASEDGKEVIREKIKGKAADYQHLAEQLVVQLIARGAARLVRR